MTEGISMNNVSPALTMSAGKTQESVVGKDEFLKLLTFQLRSQNPLKPYDNQEFAAQLAQFSQLEQLVDIRSMIEEQIYSNNILTQTIANSALPGMIGKTALAMTDNFVHDGFSSQTLSYELPSNVASGVLEIKDDSGRIIKTIDLSGSNLNKGNHKIEWDGTNNKGETVGAGRYQFSVSGTDNNGSNYNANTYLYGKIESVRFKSEGTMLIINGTEVALNTISDISGG